MSLDNRANVYLKYVSGNSTEPDVADGVRMHLLAAEVGNTVKKKITYIPKPKSSSSYVEGPDTLALDLLKTDDGWSITGKLFGTQTSNKESVLHIVKDARNDGMVTKQNLSFTTFGDSSTSSHEWHVLGASQIKRGSVTVVDSGGNLLTEGTDYNIDYNRGLIEVFDSGNISKNTDGEPTETLNISYRYDLRNDNLAQTMKKMVERGGNIAMEINPNTDTQKDFSISSVDTSVDRVSISGDETDTFERGDEVVINNSTGNDGNYIVDFAQHDSNDGETDLYLGNTTMITNFNATNDVVTVTGDVSSISGSIRVVDSNNNNQEFTVSSTTYNSSSDTTDISVSESVTADEMVGHIIYSDNINDGTADGAITKKEGSIYMVEIDTFDIKMRAKTPENVEVSIEAREAIDKV